MSKGLFAFGTVDASRHRKPRTRLRAAEFIVVQDVMTGIYAAALQGQNEQRVPMTLNVEQVVGPHISQTLHGSVRSAS